MSPLGECGGCQWKTKLVLSVLVSVNATTSDDSKSRNKLKNRYRLGTNKLTDIHCFEVPHTVQSSIKPVGRVYLVVVSSPRF